MRQPIKYYQVGSFAVGNRLLDPNERSVQAGASRSNTLTSGHRACQGCGEALGARYVLDVAMRAAEGRLIAANATGCLEVFSTPYPESAWQLPWIHSLFGNAPAVAIGVAAAMKLRQRGLHEHRGPALRRDAARRPDRNDAGRRPRAGQRLRPGQERAADRHGPRNSVHGDASGAGRIRSFSRRQAAVAADDRRVLAA
jgi:pyruvate/2-oxoacid:ferredoxin oxidoreductase beta subunit